MPGKNRNLIVTGTLLSLAACLLMATLFYALAGNVHREVSTTKSGAAVTAIRKNFLELATPVQRDLALLAQWGRTGLIDLNTPQPLKNKLLPLLDASPIVSGLILADTDGREYFMLKADGNRMIRSAGAYHPGQETQILELDANGAVVRTQRARRSFDPRTRTWFAGALQTDPPGTIFWTAPYRFMTIGKVGLTAAIRWPNKTGQGTVTIAAMDILLDTLQQFIAGLKVTPETQIVLLRNDGSVMPAQSAHALGTPGGTAFLAPNDLPDGPVSDALAVWIQSRDRTSFSFISSKTRWWASFQPLQPQAANTWIGVLIPQADLIGNIHRQWVLYGTGIGALFLAAIATIVLLLRRHSLQPAAPRRTAEAVVEEIQALIAGGENAQLEFKSTLRTNLKNGKRDKAIELAWLKSVTAFMNSEGGTLLAGVDDTGAIRGIAEDGFENEDKCLLHVKNLIHEHIGSEFAGMIDCRLHVIDAHTVVALTCRKSEQPIFLKVGRNEDFFIRSGPSTTKLSMSGMVAYLNQRK